MSSAVTQSRAGNGDGDAPRETGAADAPRPEDQSVAAAPPARRDVADGPEAKSPSPIDRLNPDDDTAADEAAKPSETARATAEAASGATDSRRLPSEGRLIDRSRALSFSFNGRRFDGFEGDCVSSGLLAADRLFVARSPKLHRPRGAMTADADDPGARFSVVDPRREGRSAAGAAIEVFEGLRARSVRGWPTLKLDIGEVVGWARSAASIKTRKHARAMAQSGWDRVVGPAVKAVASLWETEAPSEQERASGAAADAPSSAAAIEQVHFTVDVLVVGGGVAGLRAARSAADSGARVMLVERSAYWGGRALVDGGKIDSRDAASWVGQNVAALGDMPNVVMRTRATVEQISPAAEDGAFLCVERLTDHIEPAAARGPNKRIWRVRSRRVVLATGAAERLIPFANNDLPGVMTASAVRDYLDLYAVAAGRRIALYTNNDDAYRTAIALIEAGVEVPAIVDARQNVRGDLPRQAAQMGAEVIEGAAIARAEGWSRIEAIQVAELRASGRLGASETIECDALAASGGWSPRLALWSQAAGGVAWDDATLTLHPHGDATLRDAEATVECAGSAAGLFDLAAALADGAAAGAEAARAIGFTPKPSRALDVEQPREGPMAPAWFAPAEGRDADGGLHFIDFKNDVTVADLEHAAHEGDAELSYDALKTALDVVEPGGFDPLARDATLALLADAQNRPVPEVVAASDFAAPADAAAASLTPSAGRSPERKTPLHGWHERHGAEWREEGGWRSVACYPQLKDDGAVMESRAEARRREVDAARKRVGLFDVSPLGKIEISGAEAGALVDRLFTDRMSEVPPGRCRYGVMCDEAGYVIEDGVIARLDDGESEKGRRFLFHTPSGGAARVSAWIERARQGALDGLDAALDAHFIDVTEQFGQIVVAGPKAREVLQALSGDIDFSAHALPHMSWSRGELAGARVRVFSVSFSGERSFEVAAPARAALGVWETIFEASRVYGAALGGSEALNIMRTEKGFAKYGAEFGVTRAPDEGLAASPLDLGLGWAVPEAKTNFIGARALGERAKSGARPQLIGLATEEPTDMLPIDAIALENGEDNAAARPIGRVTSSVWSPALKRSIALGLVENGVERMGEDLTFALSSRRKLRAKIVDRRFFDPDDERLAL